MAFIVFLLVLVVAAIIVLPVIAIVTANSSARRLRAEMAALISRVSLSGAKTVRSRRTPAHSSRHGADFQAGAEKPQRPADQRPRRPRRHRLWLRPSQWSLFAVETSRPIEAPPLPVPPLSTAVQPPVAVPVPKFLSIEPEPSADSRTLENRIGSQWFNRVGILAVLIGVAWFLKFAFDNHWIGPLGRVLIGLLAGAALIVWSERFPQERGFRSFLLFAQSHRKRYALSLALGGLPTLCAHAGQCFTFAGHDCNHTHLTGLHGVDPGC